MQKHVGAQLPDIALFDQSRSQTKKVDQLWSPHKLEKEDAYIDQKEILDRFGDATQSKTKCSIGIVIAHIFYLSETLTDYLNLNSKRVYPTGKTLGSDGCDSLIISRLRVC